MSYTKLRQNLFRTIVALGLAAAATTSTFGQGNLKSLFDGIDLRGWKVPEGDHGHWRAVDASIDYDARSEAKGDRNLWTEKEYGDFVLQFDWRFKDAPATYDMPTVLPDGSYKTDEKGKVIRVARPNADSGVFLRGSTKAQVNLWCWPVGSGEVWGYRTDKQMPPEVRAAVTPKVRADRPVGQWNHMEIQLLGDRLTVVLNGQTVIQNARLPGIPKKGPIGLQHHGGMRNGKYTGASSLVQFRGLYIMEVQ